MTRDEYARRLLGADAEQAIPASVDQWPAIRERLAGARWPWSGRLRVLAVLSVVAIAVSVLVATPAGAAAGRALLPKGLQQRFGLVIESPGATQARKPAGVAGSAQSSSPTLTLAEAQARAAFPIPTPSRLPEGIVFRGALVTEGGRTVVLSYGRADGSPGGMGFRMQEGTPAGGAVVPAPATTRALVNGHDAVAAEGGYDSPGHWNASLQAGMLSWQEGGITYTFSYSGLRLSRDDMIRIAESLR